LEANKLKLGGSFIVRCFDKEGILLWEEKSKNMVMESGLAHILDCIFSLDSVVANPNYYVGLIDGDPTIESTDTLALHGGWSEVVSYSQPTRPPYIKLRNEMTVDNSASLAVFSINASATIGGTFICSASSGTTGLLLSAAAFKTGNKSVTSGQTLEVVYMFASAST